MPRGSPDGAYAKVQYQVIKDEDDNPRASTSSSTPILPKLDAELETELEDRDDARAFETDGLELYYKPIEGYEGAHRFDPDYRWDKSEEREIVWKVRKSIQVLWFHLLMIS
jgi:hypothetical protein